MWKFKPFRGCLWSSQCQWKQSWLPKAVVHKIGSCADDTYQPPAVWLFMGLLYVSPKFCMWILQLHWVSSYAVQSLSPPEAHFLFASNALQEPSDCLEHHVYSTRDFAIITDESNLQINNIHTRNFMLLLAISVVLLRSVLRIQSALLSVTL